MNLPWELILETILRLINDCDDAQTARRHRVRVWIVVTKALEEVGIPRRDFPAARREVMARYDQSSEAEISAFLTGGVQGLLSV